MTSAYYDSNVQSLDLRNLSILSGYCSIHI
jgi:hypothetical protein